MRIVRPETKRLLLFGLGGLLLGGIIHIAVILLIPHFATRDAWTVLGRFGPDGAFHLLPATRSGTAALADLDPAMAHAACRFSLQDGPIRIRATLPDDFWSLAVFDRQGSNVYSLNDRTAERTDIDLVLATPLQMLRLRENPNPVLDNAIVVELPLEQGFVLIRAFVADPTRSPAAIAALEAADCRASLAAPNPASPDPAPP